MMKYPYFYTMTYGGMTPAQENKYPPISTLSTQPFNYNSPGSYNQAGYAKDPSGSNIGLAGNTYGYSNLGGLNNRMIFKQPDLRNNKKA